MGKAALTLVLVALSPAAVAACGGSDKRADGLAGQVQVADPGAIHVHGLGVNPADGALFIASHTGLFRAAPGERTAERVGDRFQDTMGFTVTGPDRFLGSGHPDGRDELPPFLGLISTEDAGRDWKPVSLLGEQDFHVLEAARQRIYGYGTNFETRIAGLLVSDDAGGSWQKRAAPEPLLSLAIAPAEPDRVMATGERGVYLSGDAGRRWRSISREAGFVAWPRPAAAYLVTLDGRVRSSVDAGVSWQPVGDTGGRPAAFESGGSDLYVALHNGTIKRSKDGGRSWSVRTRPQGR